MMHGMTGFASQLITLTSGNEKAQASLQLKTLNSRYFEANIKVPSALSFLEIELNKLFKKELHRGYIYFTITLDNNAIFKGNISPSLNIVQDYLSAIDSIKKTFGISDSVTLPMIINLPNVFAVSERKADEATVKQIMDTIHELTHIVIRAREKEGEYIQKDLIDRLAIVHDGVALIKTRSLSMINEYKQKISALLQELDGQDDGFAETRKNALYAILDKIDIHEEIVRLNNHVKSLQQFLESATIEKGKKIDFTLQEMGREINTIAAKCSDSEISSHAIDIKVEIEKAREQVQNIV